jgi:hypothetical protein
VPGDDTAKRLNLNLVEDAAGGKYASLDEARCITSGPRSALDRDPAQRRGTTAISCQAGLLEGPAAPIRGFLSPVGGTTAISCQAGLLEGPAAP